MNEQFEPMDDNEVLFVSVGRVLMPNPTFKVGEFLDALAQAVSDREGDWTDENEGWFGDGLTCEALRFNANGWQRGRVRLRLEFCPEQSRPKLLDGRREDGRREDGRRERSSRYDLPYRTADKPEPRSEARFDDAYGEPDDYQ